MGWICCKKQSYIHKARLDDGFQPSLSFLTLRESAMTIDSRFNPPPDANLGETEVDDVVSIPLEVSIRSQTQIWEKREVFVPVEAQIVSIRSQTQIWEKQKLIQRKH
jgi:hypothetical protein